MKEYTGSVYVGVVGPETDIAVCRDSIERITLRPGDVGPHYIRATKGYEARQAHFDAFLKDTQFSFILLLDHDQVYPPDTLERLREHKLPYVSGFYLRRAFAPILPVWYDLPADPLNFPYHPTTQDPPRGQLTELGASGWGCILVHREVVEAVQALLKGEDLVIEDDMDIFPYDLDKVMTAIKDLETLEDGYEADTSHIEAVKVLRSEIRPLRCLKSTVGSDIRFPFYARQAGYILMGDADVRCGHVLNYPLDPDDYSQQSEAYRKDWAEKVEHDCEPEALLINDLQGKYGVTK